MGVGTVRRSFKFRRSSASPRKACSIGLRSNLVGAVRRRFSKSPPQEPNIVFHHTNSRETFTNEEEEEEEREQANEEQTLKYSKEVAGGGDGGNNEGDAGASSPSSEDLLLKEDLAAIKIQAFFRGHLARRAYRALRSLVKLQAVVRGAQVRSQARVALNCMHALVRLKLRIHDRQLLSISSPELS